VLNQSNNGLRPEEFYRLARELPRSEPEHNRPHAGAVEMRIQEPLTAANADAAPPDISGVQGGKDAVGTAR
jgi:hypothetical protein